MIKDPLKVEYENAGKTSDTIRGQCAGLSSTNEVVQYIGLPTVQDFLGSYLIHGRDNEEMKTPFCCSLCFMSVSFFEWRPLALNWIPGLIKDKMIIYLQYELSFYIERTRLKLRLPEIG